MCMIWIFINHFPQQKETRQKIPQVLYVFLIWPSLIASFVKDYFLPDVKLLLRIGTWVK